MTRGGPASGSTPKGPAGVLVEYAEEHKEAQCSQRGCLPALEESIDASSGLDKQFADRGFLVDRLDRFTQQWGHTHNLDFWHPFFLRQVDCVGNQNTLKV